MTNGEVEGNPRLRSVFVIRASSFALCPVGSDGLEPSPAWLRARYAAANTLIPCILFTPTHNWRGGNRTLAPVLIRDLLSPLSYAPMSGAEGTRTLACRIKSPVCCRYTTTPKCWPGVCLSIVLASSSCSSFPVVALRVELSTTRLSAVSGQPALDYLVPTSLSNQSGWQDSNLRLRAPKARGFAATLHPVQSERPELNRRSPGPRPGAITRLRYVLLSVARAGVEPAFPA